MTIRKYFRRGDLILPEYLRDPDRVIQLPPLKASIGGFFRVWLNRGKSGTLKYDTGWFPNLITDFGMDTYGNAAGLSNGNGGAGLGYCCVGTGTSAPSFADTALIAPLAVKGFSISTVPSYVAGPPAYSFQSMYWAFPLGGVIGNISEICAGPLSSVSGTTLSRARAFSRQLILDASGNPNTISVTASDQLNTSYQLRLYFDLTDSTDSIVISGNTYGGIKRRAKTSSFGVGGIMDTQPPPSSWGGTQASLYTGGLGPTSSNPGGSVLSTSTFTHGPYTPGTFTKAITNAHWPTTNLGTVMSLFVGCTCLGFWQIQMLPGFPKTGSNTLDLSWSIAWARY